MDGVTILAIGGLVAGVVGSAAGLAALAYAHQANKLSSRSNKLAHDANDLSKGSNTIALDARRIAMEANEYSDRAEARDTELHDVRWTGEWVQAGLFRVTKHGDSRALKAAINVTIDGETESVRIDDIDSGTKEFDMRFENARRHQLFYTDQWRRYHTARPSSPNAAGSPAPALQMHQVAMHVQWITERNNPHTHHEDDREPMPYW